MKRLLPAAALLLALTACTGAATSATEESASAAPETAETATRTVEVTMDASAYTDQLDMQTLRIDPRFFLDAAGTRAVPPNLEATSMTVPGSQTTYELTLPQDTETIYVTGPVLFLTESMEEQSLPAQAGAACDAFTVQTVEISREEENALEVTIDPASAALPVNLVLGVEGYRFSGQNSSHLEWKQAGGDVTLKEWTATFSLEGTAVTPRQALDGGTLYWYEEGRFVKADDVTFTCEGLTLTPLPPVEE